MNAFSHPKKDDLSFNGSLFSLYYIMGSTTFEWSIPIFTNPRVPRTCSYKIQLINVKINSGRYTATILKIIKLSLLATHPSNGPVREHLGLHLI